MDYFLFEFLSSSLLEFDESQLFLRLSFVALDLFLERVEHLDVVLFFPTQHVDLVFEFIVVGNSVIESRYGLIQVGLQVLDLRLQHHVMSLAVLFLQLVQLALLLLVLFAHIL